MWVLLVVLGLLLAVVIYDLVQPKHAILRNFPIIGHFRYLLEAVGPELRQYIVTRNDEERPFSRDQRRWVYASSKKQNNYFGFGTDNDLERAPNYLIVKQAEFPAQAPAHAQDAGWPIPCAKALGAARGRKLAFRPSAVCVSAMSYGSLSAAAVEAINRGCALAGVLQNTGEGGIARYHDHGGDLIWQLGTGYFGARDAAGRFDMAQFLDTCAQHRVRAVEVKLSQGAKPGKGGILPAAKVTPEIAAIRGVEVGRDCISPPAHTAFGDADSLLDFVEKLADASGLPVGIKSAVGEHAFWGELARLMADTNRGVDYIAIDGGEGGTGAAPLVFSDHVALPFKVAASRVYRILVEQGMQDDVVLIGSGKLGFPESSLLAFGLGCDIVAVAREAMMAIGCLQAQRCHTGLCPTGVATQSRWLMRGLDPRHKAHRLANYLAVLRQEILWLTHACGFLHPALVTLDQFEILDDRYGSRPAREVYHYEAGWGLPPPKEQQRLAELMRSQPAGLNVQ